MFCFFSLPRPVSRALSFWCFYSSMSCFQCLEFKKNKWDWHKGIWTVEYFKTHLSNCSSRLKVWYYLYLTPIDWYISHIRIYKVMSEKDVDKFWHRFYEFEMFIHVYICIIIHVCVCAYVCFCKNSNARMRDHTQTYHRNWIWALSLSIWVWGFTVYLLCDIGQRLLCVSVSLFVKYR